MSKLLLHRARSGLLLSRRIGAPTPAAARGLLPSGARPHRRRPSWSTNLSSAPAPASAAALPPRPSPSPRLLSLLDPAASDPLVLGPSHFDAIMVLGGGIETSDGSLPAWVLTRLDFAAELQREVSRCSSSPPSASPSSPSSSPSPLPSSPPIVLLGAGTPHKPPPPDGDSGRALTEAKAAARYLLSLPPGTRGRGEGRERGAGASSGEVRRRGAEPAPPLSPRSILKEEASFDTVGNALFALTTHALPAGWERIAVVTSAFHMPRARAVFAKTFALASGAFRAGGGGGGSRCRSSRSSLGAASAAAPAAAAAAAKRGAGAGAEGGAGEEGPLPLLPRPFELSFLATADRDDLPGDVREARAAREAASTARWIADTENIETLQQLHAWVHAEHLCYSTAKQELFGSFAAANSGIDPKALASY